MKKAIGGAALTGLTTAALSPAIVTGVASVSERFIPKRDTITQESINNNGDFWKNTKGLYTDIYSNIFKSDSASV